MRQVNDSPGSAPKTKSILGGRDVDEEADHAG
jgi:hypothetical protein